MDDIEQMERLHFLRMEQIQFGEFVEPIKKHRGHEFALQSSSGRNPYCEICVSTIWRISQQWRKCKVCGLRTHDKCINEVKRPCAGLKTRRDNFKLNLSLCPESGLMAQTYKCFECLRPIGFGKGPELEPRICDYTGKYYCKKCHWNDEMVIPARVVRNWDCTKRPVCRASKQLLSLVEQKPIINLNRDNPALFKYVGALQKMQKLRSSIMFMKCYFVCCRQARKLRILQHLNKYQHFVESEDMYSLTDLVQVATGPIVQEVEQVVEIFKTHITHDCEICKGNAFICELCDDDHLIFPFNEGVSICKTCYACFHKPCFDRRSKRCTRCQRRRSRKAVVTVEEDETEEEQMDEEQKKITEANASTATLVGSVQEEKGIEIGVVKENEEIAMSLAEEMREMEMKNESQC
uniref:Phorbol-ester/DAG-type domain-containing protein n=1 Tax=Bursaphelenchus xylophilus TaxID=6326 RepID=A0A1I7RUW1_BURXY